MYAVDLVEELNCRYMEGVSAWKSYIPPYSVDSEYRKILHNSNIITTTSGRKV